MREALSSGRPQQREFTTSAQRVYEHTYTPFRDANGEEKVLVLLRDISDRKASRAAIIRSEQLAAIGELAAGVAHEINNPINGVLNYAELLIEGHPQLETVHELANMIVSEGERVAKIVKSLLDFSRRDSEYRIAVDFGQLLPDTLTITNALLRSSFITVNVDIVYDLPQIVCVPQEIQQVFVNLVNNARDALNQKYPLGGPDKILDIAAQIEQVDHDQFVTIAFHDHGSGIPADLIDKVTSPFFSTKPQGYGTGLGLTISHEIIAAHGGRRVIESREGDYTKVAVRLPVAPSAAESDSHDQGPHLSC
jgi:signal transduction histidine kinase